MKNNREILRALEDYQAFDDREQAMVEQTRQFVRSADSVAARFAVADQSPITVLDRAHGAGHLTASIWLLSRSRDAVLLTHHRKLGRWMQLGGHVEAGESLFEAALREAREESGLDRITPLSRHIFDIDVHRIPIWKSVPSHLHYDVRFVMEAQGMPVISAESNELAWVSLTSATHFCQNESLLRMVRKTVHWA